SHESIMHSYSKRSKSTLLFSIIPHPPTSTLFPYTTLFRSGRHGRDGGDRAHPSPGASLRARAPRPEGKRHRGSSHADSLQAKDRSEEHTSELQSLAYLVCRLLLEKKKMNYNNLHMLRTLL